LVVPIIIQGAGMAVRAPKSPSDEMSADAAGIIVI